jgi:hypothetical protein
VLFWMSGEQHSAGRTILLDDYPCSVVHRVRDTELLVVYCPHETWLTLRDARRTLRRDRGAVGTGGFMVGAAFHVPRDVAEIAAVLWQPHGSGMFAYFEHAVDAAVKLSAL